MTTKGFTLLEVILYTALFAVFMSGTLVASYYLVDSASRDREHQFDNEETAFILDTLAAIVTGADHIEVPAGGETGEVVSLVKKIGNNSHRITLTKDNITHQLFLQRDNLPLVPLSASSSVNKFTVSHLDTTSLTPAQLIITLTLHGREYNISHYFSN